MEQLENLERYSQVMRHVIEPLQLGKGLSWDRVPRACEDVYFPRLLELLQHATEILGRDGLVRVEYPDVLRASPREQHDPVLVRLVRVPAVVPGKLVREAQCLELA